MNRWLALLLAGAAVAAACLPAPASAQEAEALVAKGRTLLGRGDYPGARDAFLAAVEKDGKSVDARRGAAEALLGLGRSDDAVEQALAGLGLVENRDGGLWLLAARGYLQKGDTLPVGSEEEIRSAYADAKAKAAQALRQDPSLTLARAVMAKACRLTDEPDRAAEVLREGLEKDPRSFDLLHEKGMLHLKKAEHGAAVEAFGKALEVDPKSADAWYQKAFALAFTREWEPAYEAAVKAAVLEPAGRRALQFLARYAGDKSIPHYRAILKERPDHAWAHAYLAYYLAGAKDENGALTESKAALALQAGDVDLIAWHGQVLDMLGRRDEAIGAWKEALKRNALTKLAWDRLTDIATNPAAPTRPDLRRELIDFLGKRRPDDGFFWNNVGLLYRDTLKDYRRSLEAYLKAAEFQPSDQGIQNDTGLIYLYHGRSIGEDAKKALPYFLRTVELVEVEGQDPTMGYRDSLENLAVYHGPAPMGVESDPEKALSWAEKRNDPDLLRRLPKGIGAASAPAAAVRAWAERELKK